MFHQIKFEMKKLFLFIVVAIFSLNLSAQKASYTQTIRGVVIDADTEMSLPGASVLLVGSSPPVGTITDADGEFYLKNVPVGRQSIQISFIGYKPAKLSNIQVVTGKETVIVVRIEENVEELDEVLVTGGRRKSEAGNEMALLSARSFTIEETERYAGSLGDPSRMAANFAGVMSVSDQRNDIVIRGNSPIGLLWQLDGITVPNPNHFGALGTTGGPVSMLNNNLLSNSDFFTGAFPAQYGNAISGVFDLKMRNGNNQKHEFVGQIGFNGFELGAEGPFSKTGKASYLINFRYSTLEVMNNLGVDFGTGAAVPQYKDLSFKVNFPLKKGRISWFGIGGLSYIELHDDVAEKDDPSYGVSGTNTDFGSDMFVSGLSHLHYFNDKSRLLTSISAQGMRSTTVLDSLNKEHLPYPFYRNTFSEMKYAIQTTFKHKFTAKDNISFGASADFYNINLNDSVKRYAPEDFPAGAGSNFMPISDVDGSFSLFQSFAEWQHRFSDDLSLYLGAHFQHSTTNSQSVVEPRVALRWAASARHSFHLGGGMHSQLQPHQMYFVKTELSDGSLIETNRELGFTKSNQFILGYDFNATENFRIKIETYYQALTNIPISPNDGWFSIVNEGSDFAFVSKDSLLNEGTGTNYGVELTVEKFFSNNYYFLITTSIYESKYKAYDQVERNTAFNGNYVVNALFGYEFQIGKNNALSVDVKGVLAGGKRILPFLLPESIAAGREIRDYENIYRNRYDDYMKIDLRIAYKLNGKHVSQEWALDIQNVTDNQNVFREAYNVLAKDVKTEYQSGLFPMFLYRIRF